MENSWISYHQYCVEKINTLLKVPKHLFGEDEKIHSKKENERLWIKLRNKK